jgi:hypothetical protein
MHVCATRGMADGADIGFLMSASSQGDRHWNFPNMLFFAA